MLVHCGIKTTLISEHVVDQQWSVYHTLRSNEKYTVAVAAALIGQKITK
jgi:hypothetical protein